MEILEQFTSSKSGLEERNEDVIVVTDDYVAVIDGTTDNVDLRDYPGNRSSGKFAADTLAEAIQALDPGLDRDTVIDHLTLVLKEKTEAANALNPDPPTAMCAIYSKSKQEIWRIGDIWVGIDDEFSNNEPLINIVSADARAAYTELLLLSGKEEEEVQRDDQGRGFIMPILMRLHKFANHPQSRFAYGVFNGRTVPDNLRETFYVEENQEIVLATNGYPQMYATLSETEEALQKSLYLDPLRIDIFPATKGLRIDGQSFDDRAYIRFKQN